MVRLHLNWRTRIRARMSADPVPEVPVHAPDTDTRLVLWQALAGLPPRQRAVLVLRYYEDLSEAEIADALGVTRGTVKSTAARAPAKLRDHPGLRADAGLAAETELAANAGRAAGAGPDDAEVSAVEGER